MVVVVVVWLFLWLSLLVYIGDPTTRILQKVIRRLDNRQQFLREFARICPQLAAMCGQDLLQLCFLVVAEGQRADIDLFYFGHDAKLAREHFQDQDAETQTDRNVVVDLAGPRHQLFEVYQDFIQRGVLDTIKQALLSEAKLYCNSRGGWTYDEEWDVCREQ